MAIFGNQGVEVTIKSMMLGVVFQNVIRYHAVTATEHENPTDISVYFTTTVMPLWKACLSSSAQTLGVNVATNHPPGIPPYAPVWVPYSAVGDVTGDAMAPFDQASIIKIPDSLNAEPPEAATRLRSGSIRISGIGEGSQAAGVVGSGLIDDLNALGEALETFDISGTTYLMHYGGKMEVLPKTDPPTYFDYAVPVLETVASGKVGTQNTRKY